LEAEPLDTAMSWIDEHRQIWTDRFDRLGQHIEAIQRAEQLRRDRTTTTDAHEQEEKEP
jgi:hypothetical protein